MRFERPDEFPEFASQDIIDTVSGNNNVDSPIDQKKKYGWVRREPVNRQWLNWLARYTYLWIGYLAGFSGRVTTTGGSTTQTISIPGVKATDIVIATMNKVGATPVSIVSANPGVDSVVITFSGNPSTDHEFSYKVYSN